MNGISLPFIPENVTVHTFSVKRSSEFKTEGRFDRDSRIAADSVAYSQNALTSAGYFPYYMYRQKNTVGNLENVGFSLPGHEGLYNVYIMEELQHIFAVGAGLFTCLIRYYGSYPEGVSFAILFMNILTPYIDGWTKHKVFATGGKK